MPVDPEKVVTPRNLKDQSVTVLKAEIPQLAKALGVTPEELFRSITDLPTRNGGRAADSGECTCCHSDSW